MLLSHYFASLKDRLNQMEKTFPLLNEEQRFVLYEEVLVMREISDQVVEDWLQFEEKLAVIQRMFEINSEEVGGNQSALPKQNELVLPRHLAFHFLKGKGYFELSMYEEAVKSFSHIIRQDPDLELARLYLAFGFLMSRRLEVAYRQFQLLAETTAYAVFAAVAYNAMGVISVLEGRGDQGLQWFERALKVYPDLKEARFNQVLTHVALQQFHDAAEVAKQLLQENQDDLELGLIYYYSCAQTGQKKEAFKALQQCEKMDEQASALRPIALGYEKLGHYKEALALYRRLLPDLRSDANVWHGIGWTLWQMEKSEEALPYLKKAITLDPDRSDYACSYAWVLLGLNQREKAQKALEHIHRKDQHPLSRSGLSHLSLIQGAEEQAEKFARELVHHKDPKIQGLGHYHMGRVFMEKKDYNQALHHFNQSLDLSNIKESHLFSGLIHYLNDEKEKAQERWQPFLHV